MIYLFTGPPGTLTSATGPSSGIQDSAAAVAAAKMKDMENNNTQSLMHNTSNSSEDNSEGKKRFSSNCSLKRQMKGQPQNGVGRHGSKKISSLRLKCWKNRINFH